MDWICVKTVDDVIVTINMKEVLVFYYKKDTDLTVFEFTRANYPPVFVKGDVALSVRRLLNSHNNNYVSQVGG